MSKQTMTKMENQTNIVTERYKDFVAAVDIEFCRRYDEYCANLNSDLILRYLGSPADGIKIQPAYADVFYNIGAFIKIALSFDYRVSVTTEYNSIGVMSPVLNFYPNNV